MRSLPFAVVALGLALSACGPDDEPEPECDERLGCVDVSLLEAMAIADEYLPGGVIVDAELSNEEGDAPIADVDIYVDGETREIVIDAMTGEVIDDRVDAEDQGEGAMQAAAIEGSTGMITLPIAVMTAEASQDGTAVSAELEVEERLIEVVLFRDAERVVVTIDLDDGSVASVNDQGG